MTRTHGNPPLLARLEAVLDSYGARPERWPEDMRTELAAFIAADVYAARLFAREQALDHALARPEMPLPPGLDARILAAAASLPQQATGRAVPSPAHAVSLPAHKTAVPAGKPCGGGGDSIHRLQIAAARAERRMWPELTLLAASLFLGLLIGVSGRALPALEGVAVITGNDEAWGAIAGSLSEPGGPSDQEAL